MGAQRFLLNDKNALRKEISKSRAHHQQTLVKMKKERVEAIAKIDKNQKETKAKLKRELALLHTKQLAYDTATHLHTLFLARDTEEDESSWEYIIYIQL